MKAVVYLMQVSACTGIFYLFYYLFLRRLTFFKLNRWYLLATLLFSFVIPAITIPVSPAQASAIMRPAIYAQQAQRVIEPLPVVVNNRSIPVPQINWMLVIRYVYLVMALISITHLLISLALFFWRMRNEELLQIGNIKILKADKVIGNSSFLNVIFINDEGLEPYEVKQIIAHEMLHVSLMHSADRLIARLIQVILWFNPFAYLYIRAIEENHEFEVDRIAANEDDKGIYAQLLFKLASSGQDYLFHGFSKVPIKKRIAMLFNQPTKNMKKIIYVFMLPLVVISCLAFANLKKDASGIKNNIKNSGTVQPQKEKLSKRAGFEKMGEELKAFTAYLKTDEAKERKQFSRSLISKTIVVKITGERNYKTLLQYDRRGIFGQYNGHEFLIETSYGQEKQLSGLLKPGDEITVNVFEAGMGWGKGAPIDITPAYVIKNSQKIFQLAEADKIPAYPFLSEANQVHYAEGQVSDMVKYANGKWKSALLETVNGYKFNLSFKPNAPDMAAIADGDHVRLRFVNEVKTGAKQYKINEWVSISNNMNDYGIKNPELFNTYYADAPKVNTVQNILKEDTLRTTPIKYGPNGQPIRFAQKDAPQSLLDEYTDILKKSNLPYKKGDQINLQPVFSAADRERLKALYIQMSRKQQLQQYVRVVPRFGIYTKHGSPTQQQLITWQHSVNYLIRMNGKEITNSELSKYKLSDLDFGGVGHIFYTKNINNKNAVINKRPTYCVELNTNEYVANCIKQQQANTAWRMDSWGKGHELLVMENW